MRAVGASGRSRWGIRTRTLVRALGIGGASLCLVGVGADPLPAMDRAGGRLSGTQGQILVVKVTEADRSAKVSGTFLN